MKIYLEAFSEKGKNINKGANEFICANFTVHRELVGQVELYLFNDIKNLSCFSDEWSLKYRADEDEDWKIIAQGNLSPKSKNKN